MNIYKKAILKLTNDSLRENKGYRYRNGGLAT